MNTTISFDQAGPDAELLRAEASAWADRTAGIAEVLASCRGDAALRGHRSAVLAAACTGSDVADEWLKEEPQNPDAQLLYARKLVALALRERSRPKAQRAAIVKMAERACRAAAAADPQDPTPLVALLTLRQLARERPDGPRTTDFDLSEGPWDLLAEIGRIDPHNREAHHRFLQCLLPRNGGSIAATFAFVDYVQANLPVDSDPQTVALAAHVEHFRERITRDPSALIAAEREWRTPQVQQVLMNLFEDGWFQSAARRRFPPITDLSYLAYVMYKSGFVTEAHAVFEAMGQYASALPWSIHGDPQQHFQQARTHSASVYGALADRHAILRADVHHARNHRGGDDLDLARAVSSAQATRPTGICDVLKASRGRWDLRASRSRLLASVCAETNLAELLLSDDRSNPDSWMLYARVAGIRAHRAVHHSRDDAPQFIQSALTACRDAHVMDPADPTPLVELISLARLAPYVDGMPAGLGPVPGIGSEPAALLDPFRREPGREDLAGIRGPWHLLDAVLAIEPLHREAHLQFLRCLFPVHGGSLEQMWSFAYAIGPRNPWNSDPQLVTLYACDEEYRHLREHGMAASGQWAQQARLRLLLDLVDEGWLKAARSRQVLPVRDLSYLAYALFMAGRYLEAREVFTTLGPYMDPVPWARHGDPATAFAWARAKCESNRGLPGWSQIAPT